jgi:hypothetical protein
MYMYMYVLCDVHWLADKWTFLEILLILSMIVRMSLLLRGNSRATIGAGTWGGM